MACISDSLLRHSRMHTDDVNSSMVTTGQAHGQQVDTSAQTQFPSWLETIPDLAENPQLPVSPEATTLTASYNGTLDSIDGSLGCDVFPEAPNWLVDDDFDLNAFNSSVVANTTMGFLPPVSGPVDYDNTLESSMLHAPNGTSECNQDEIRKIWFNYIDTAYNHNTDPITSGSSLHRRAELDDEDRQNLSQRLQPRVPSQPLPSTDFLVSLPLP